MKSAQATPKLSKAYENLLKIKTPVLIELKANYSGDHGGGDRARVLYPNGFCEWFGANHGTGASSTNLESFTTSCFIIKDFSQLGSLTQKNFKGSLKETVAQMFEFDKNHGNLTLKSVLEI